MSILTAEARKARTTRTNLWLGIGAVAVVGVGALTTTSSTPAEDLAGPIHEQASFLVASVNLSLFALLVGVRSATDEFGHGTINWTLLSVHRRWRVVTAKAVTAAVYGALVAAVAQAAGIAVALAISSGQGGDLRLGGSDLAAVIALTAASGLWAAIGVGVGTVVRHQVAAAVAVVVWVLAVENVAAPLLGDAGRYLPGQAAHALVDVDISSPLLSRSAAAAVLVAYTAAAVGVAAARLERRAITA